MNREESLPLPVAVKIFSLTSPDVDPELFPAPAPAAASRQKARMGRMLDRWRSETRRIQEARAGAVSGADLLRERARPFASPAFDRTLDELLGDVLKRAVPRVRAQLRAFLGFVAAAYLDGKALAASHRELLQLVGWKERTGQFWISRLMRSGGLMVDPTFIERCCARHAGDPLHPGPCDGGAPKFARSSAANVYSPGLFLWGAINAARAPQAESCSDVPREGAGRARISGDACGDAAPAEPLDRLRAVTDASDRKRKEGSQPSAGAEAPQASPEIRARPAPSLGTSLQREAKREESAAEKAAIGGTVREKKRRPHAENASGKLSPAARSERSAATTSPTRIDAIGSVGSILQGPTARGADPEKLPALRAVAAQLPPPEFLALGRRAPTLSPTEKAKIERDRKLVDERARLQRTVAAIVDTATGRWLDTLPDEAWALHQAGASPDEIATQIIEAIGPRPTEKARPRAVQAFVDELLRDLTDED